MRAAIVEGYGEPVAVRQVEPVALGPHDVRVRTGASGVCHTDLSLVRGQYPFKLPIVLGHEGAGVVEELGASVSGLELGDRVIASLVSTCDTCYQCVRGRSHICERQGVHASAPRVTLNGDPLTAMAGLGTMAELMTVHEDKLVKVETDLPDEQLALIGCGVTTGVGAAMWTARVEPGSSVAVFGCGGVGLSTVQGARIAGAAQIIAVDPFPAKREAALALGATHAVDPGDGDPVEQVKSLTQGRGAEYTFEVVGLVATMEQAYAAAAWGGSVVYIGALRPELKLELPANMLHVESKRILGSVYGSAQVRRDMPKLVALTEAGRLDLGGLITRRIDLDGINGALDAIDQGETVRSVVVF